MALLAGFPLLRQKLEVAGFKPGQLARGVMDLRVETGLAHGRIEPPTKLLLFGLTLAGGFPVPCPQRQALRQSQFSPLSQQQQHRLGGVHTIQAAEGSGIAAPGWRFDWPSSIVAQASRSCVSRPTASSIPAGSFFRLLSVSRQSTYW